MACRRGARLFGRNTAESGEPRVATLYREASVALALFEELIRGVEMDLEIKRYQTMDDLEQYCYRVASVVGLLSIEIFGYENPRCRDYALYLGKALQLTNILRDVRNDAERGRIYLPLDHLQRFGVTEPEILALRYSDRFRRLAEAVAARARHFTSGRVKHCPLKTGARWQPRN